jgi:hypothetical protein
MNKLGKVFIGLSLATLLAGTGCGIGYGIKYYNLKNEKEESNSGVLNVVEELRESVKTLNEEKTVLEKEIATLNAQIDVLTAQNNADKEQIEALQETITSLNKQIQELNTQIAYYQEILKAYEDIDKLAVSFKVQDTIQTVLLVNSGEKVDVNKVANPSVTGYTFKGWSKDGENIIDLENETITEDIVFIAVFDINLNGKYVLTSPTSTDITGYRFDSFTFTENMVTETTTAGSDGSATYTNISYTYSNGVIKYTCGEYTTDLKFNSDNTFTGTIYTGLNGKNDTTFKSYKVTYTFAEN